MSLLLAWNFDEASGAVIDYSGNGRGFSLTGTTVRTAAGGGYTYGGTVPNRKGLTQTAVGIQLGPAITGLNTLNRTLVLWVKVNSAFTGWLMEWYKNPSDDTGVFGLLNLSSVFRARAKNSSGGVFESSTIAPDTGNWHCLAMTHDGATLRTYRDSAGAMVQLGSGTAMAFPVWAADALRVLDGSSTGATISDVRVYDEVLDASALTALMTIPVGAGSTPVAVSDNATVTDTAALQRQSSLADAAALTETSDLQRASTTVDGAALTEAAALASNSAGNDAATLAESGGVAGQSGATDAAVLTETAAIDRTSSATDEAQLAELVELAALAELIDVAALTEQAEVTILTGPAGSDTATIGEAASVAMNGAAVDAAAVSEQADVRAAAGGSDHAMVTETAVVTVAGKTIPRPNRGTIGRQDRGTIDRPDRGTVERP